MTGRGAGQADHHGATNPPAPFNEGFTTATLNSAAWTTVGSVTGNQPGGGSHGSTASLAASAEVYRKATVSDGQVVQVAFRVGSTTSGASMGLETGDWAGGTYHRFGVWQKDGQLLLHLFRNSAEIQRGVLMPTLEANVWYVLELAVDDGAGFRASVWKEGQSGTRYEMRYEMPRTSGWRFHVWSGSALTSLDDDSEVALNLGATNARLVGKHYEYDYALNRQTKRYYAGGTLLATRVTQFGCPGCDELTYVQGDHLGSTSTLTDGSGVVVARERYSAFGERRQSDNAAITDQLYTGQRLNVLSNLYHYSDDRSAGRFYDPLLGRFVMADSVTPGTTSIALTLLKHETALKRGLNTSWDNACLGKVLLPTQTHQDAIALGQEIDGRRQGLYNAVLRRT